MIEIMSFFHALRFFSGRYGKRRETMVEEARV